MNTLIEKVARRSRSILFVTPRISPACAWARMRRAREAVQYLRRPPRPGSPAISCSRAIPTWIPSARTRVSNHFSQTCRDIQGLCRGRCSSITGELLRRLNLRQTGTADSGPTTKAGGPLFRTAQMVGWRRGRLTRETSRLSAGRIRRSHRVPRSSPDDESLAARLTPLPRRARARRGRTRSVPA